MWLLIFIINFKEAFAYAYNYLSQLGCIIIYNNNFGISAYANAFAWSEVCFPIDPIANHAAVLNF